MPVNDSGVKVGDVVRIEAVDWAMYNDAFTQHTEFDMVTGVVYGQVVRVTDEVIAVAPQVFSDGGVRCTLALPWVTVTEVKTYE